MLPFKIKPWDHQVRGVELALAQRDFAFLFEQGAGKTATTINVIRNRFAEGKRALKTIVLCPVVVCENWRREFEAHSNLGPYVQVLSGSEKKRLKTFELFKDSKPAPIFITNYEALQMGDLLQAMLKWRPEILVCDESQRLKNPEAKRTKRAAMLADLTTHNYILSGTPVLNTPMDIFGQYRVLDRGETFGTNFPKFRAKYFYDENAGMPKQVHFPKWTERTGIINEFNKLIYQKAMRVLKKDCLDLPDLVRINIPVELGAEQRRLYNEMKKEFIAYLASGDAVVAQIAITKALRLQQLVTGYAKVESGEEITIKDNPRLDALEELLDDMIPRTEKVIVWACFNENYAQIAKLCDKLGLPYSQLHGGVRGIDRQANIDRFQTDPACRVMIANQSAGGVGVNLTAASYSIFYSRNFSLEQDLQAEARNHRGGSEIHEKITRYDLIATNTIDEIICDALKNKLDLSEKILELKKKLESTE
jgi:SNF2 family DNA or RNA helicase